MTNKPTRDDIQQALQEGAKPDADIDDPDEIPETTSTRKRKVQASESNDSQNSMKIPLLVPQAVLPWTPKAQVGCQK